MQSILQGKFEALWPPLAHPARSANPRFLVFSARTRCRSKEIRGPATASPVSLGGAFAVGRPIYSPP